MIGGRALQRLTAPEPAFKWPKFPLIVVTAGECRPKARLIPIASERSNDGLPKPDALTKSTSSGPILAETASLTPPTTCGG
jgi:hypothetical protein